MPDSSDIIAVVALVISIISFVVAVLQAVQQYVTSAEGYRKCAKSVMGRWAEHTKRTFRWQEVRFEVTYETPVIFVSAPDNDKGPIAGEAIHNVDGSPDSYEKTLTKELGDRHVPYNGSVQTTDDERSTWLTLLMSLQLSEVHSRRYEESCLKASKRGSYAPPQRQICVQVQKRKRSYDFMPDTVNKPYATTTVSHLVQVALMLGMRWLALDLETWNLRAEGNGFSLTSSPAQGLGVLISFQVTGRSTFSKGQVIPSSAIKGLAFGSVATILHGLELNLGRESDIRRTLLRLKCSQSAMDNYFKRRDHIRSVSFELIAMVGEVVRLRGSSFSFIPNPTTDHWNETFSAYKLTEEFISNIQGHINDFGTSPTIHSILEAWGRIGTVWKDSDSEIDIDMREVVHDCLDECTSFLQNKGKAMVTSVLGAHVSTVLSQLNDPACSLSSRDLQTEKEVFTHYFTDVLPSVAQFHSGASPRTPTNSAFSDDKSRQREDIWIMLQFRMCCWWLLHDFSEEDTMVLPPRLKGSRLPVFII